MSEWPEKHFVLNSPILSKALKNCCIRYDFLHNLKKLAKCVKGRFELWWNIIRISFWKIFSNIKLFHRIWSLLNSLIELVYLIFHPTFLLQQFFRWLKFVELFSIITMLQYCLKLQKKKPNCFIKFCLKSQKQWNYDRYCEKKYVILNKYFWLK
jgi:hypothetical protein